MPGLLVLGVVLLFDVLRVFLPSLITLFGRAGETPPELMGLYAAAWFVLPFLALLLRPRWALLGGAVALVVCRLLLQAGFEQLYVASAGVSAGLIFLYGCARLLPRSSVPVGLLGGVAFSVVAQMLLDGVDLVWRPGVLPWVTVAVVCGAFLVFVRQAPSTGEDLAPARTWFLFGPVLFLAGIAATSWPKDPGVSPLIIGLAAFTITSQVVIVLKSRGPGLFYGVAGMLFAVLVVALPGQALPWILLISCVGSLMGYSARGPATNGRQGVAVLGGGLVFLVAVFAYYSSYDLDLGFPNLFILPAVTALAVAAALIPPRPAEPAPPDFGTALKWSVVAGLVAVSVLAGLAYPIAVHPTPAKQGNTLKLITYNIRMGFGLDGRLSLDQIASWAAGQHPDVVLLSEVDRGWLLNGGHDDLARIARGLGMNVHFAPAADGVWGDALLTNLPVKQIKSIPLGRHDYPTGAQAQAAVIEVGGKEVGIVNTHLQAPSGQAPEVAAVARFLAAGESPLALEDVWRRDSLPLAPKPRPVILAGDLNTRPTDPWMRVLLDAGLSDPLLALGNPPTSPADAPVERIDHVLISKGLEAVSAQVPRLPYSDHLPIVATLRITPG